MSFIFSLILGVFLFGFILKMLDGPLSSFFSYYGGFFATIVAFILSTIGFVVICGVVGLIIPVIGWDLGFVLGPVYCLYCWIFKKENKLLKFILNV
ncbi:MAG: hypothetical protein IJZ59_06260 [Alphaproteobacteria bacterium]|nr:hypothetical protein [Alphaproteobacteria bacterium]